MPNQVPDLEADSTHVPNVLNRNIFNIKLLLFYFFQINPSPNIYILYF